MKYWIKERDNPQLGVYYVACGKLSKAAARRMERPGYGYNTMHAFDTETAYNLKLDRLRAEGKPVQ